MGKASGASALGLKQVDLVVDLGVPVGGAGVDFGFGVGGFGEGGCEGGNFFYGDEDFQGYFVGVVSGKGVDSPRCQEVLDFSKGSVVGGNMETSARYFCYNDRSGKGGAGGG